MAGSALFLEEAAAGDLEEDEEGDGGAKVGEMSPRPTEVEIGEWLGDQAAFLPKKGTRLDFLEIFAGEARISQAVAQMGGSAIKIGLQHGQDLRRRRHRRLLLALIAIWGPRETWVSWPCTAFCAFAALNESRGVDLSQVKREGRCFSRWPSRS